ncbi:MAG: hypothetical protein JWO82_2196 [Akkermansiaceae bacterium]|nr:hypothetical protein [Akkermansiaceae bacterium]
MISNQIRVSKAKEISGILAPDHLRSGVSAKDVAVLVTLAGLEKRSRTRWAAGGGFAPAWFRNRSQSSPSGQ